MKLRKRLVVFLVMAIMILNSFTVQATRDNNKHNGNDGNFKDVKDDHWAHDYIELMTKYGIINGYDDNYFKPEAKVSRGEFAKMMVLTMQLDLINPSTGTFQDVKKDEWLYKYVETAKPYLTGFKSDGKYYFKPSLEAQREDMAVAIVKGLGIDPNKTDMSVLDKYKDEDDISTNLRKYVAAAINEGIMKGDNKNYFNPGKPLTRAEAAAILARLIMDEKVVFDETKVVIGDTTTPVSNKKPTLTSKIEGDKVVLDWTNGVESGFTYYKVVLSKKDSTPSYPENGYAQAITKVTSSGCNLKAGDKYNDGDFGGSIKAGETYYASITAVYGDNKYTSNVVTIKIPGTSGTTKARTAVLSSSIQGDKIVLDWSNVEAAGFTNYKVVLSKSDSTPSYPDNGYAKSITSVTTSGCDLKAGDIYNSGDLGGKIKAGETYYASVTSVYGDNKYTSNVVRIKIPGTSETTKARTTVLTSSIQGDKIALDWSNVEATGFTSYKVVLSKSDSTPSYPDNGYAKSITSVTTSGCEVKAGDTYNDGDLGGQIKAGQTYYATITAVYGDKKYTSNVVKIKIPNTNQDSSEERTPVLSASAVSDGIKLSWTGTAAPKFKYYKVVLSKFNTKPSFPDDGYVTVIEDIDKTSYIVNEGMEYVDGDIGELESGRTYYVAITAVYEDGEEYYTSNTRTVTIP